MYLKRARGQRFIRSKLGCFRGYDFFVEGRIRPRVFIKFVSRSGFFLLEAKIHPAPKYLSLSTYWNMILLRYTKLELFELSELEIRI